MLFAGRTWDTCPWGADIINECDKRTLKWGRFDSASLNNWNFYFGAENDRCPDDAFTDFFPVWQLYLKTVSAFSLALSLCFSDNIMSHTARARTHSHTNENWTNKKQIARFLGLQHAETLDSLSYSVEEMSWREDREKHTVA